MAKYDVYRSPSGSGYVLDVQTDLLNGLNTRVVVPLMPILEAPKAAQRLNPVFEIGGEPHVMVTQFLSGVPQSTLGSTFLNLADQFAEITVALDMLFQGF